MADHSERIAEIQDILRSGVRSVMNDGVRIDYDHESLRKELRQLMADDDLYRNRRPVMGRFKFG